MLVIFLFGRHVISHGVAISSLLYSDEILYTIYPFLFIISQFTLKFRINFQKEVREDSLYRYI